MNVDRLPVEYGAARRSTTVHGLIARIIDRVTGDMSIVSRHPNHVALNAMNKRILRVTQARGIFRNYIQHRLNISR